MTEATKAMVEAAQRAAMIEDGCGLTIGDERVFCDDPRLPEPQPHLGCNCKRVGAAALTAAKAVEGEAEPQPANIGTDTDAAGAWSCGVCGDTEVPEKFRIFGNCYRCAAQISIGRRNRKIKFFKSECSSLASQVETQDRDFETARSMYLDHISELHSELASLRSRATVGEEEIAIAINAVCFMGCEDGKDGFRACSPEFCECRKAARAVLALLSLPEPPQPDADEVGR